MSAQPASGAATPPESGPTDDGSARADGSHAGPSSLRHRMVGVLRIGVGVVWFVNFFFILYPPNDYWSNFSNVARSFAPVSFGGPGFPDYVAAHPLFFSWLIALTTGYLAIAFTFGLTTRIACFVGSFFSAVLFAIQVGTIFVYPGATDVGEHPLYILICGVLLAGGAGQHFSLDAWLRVRWAQYVATRAAEAKRGVPAGWTGALSARQLFSYFIAGTLLSLAVGVGLIVAFPVQSVSNGTPIPTTPTEYVNLSINIDPNNTWPQYSPANFTLHTGFVEFTIVDNDSPMYWTGCPCPVTGTVGGVEVVNGSSMHTVPATNVAHSFNVPDLGLAVWSPGANTTSFEVDIAKTGQFVWLCVVPCGTGADPYTTPPMGVPGFMTGTITVT